MDRKEFYAILAQTRVLRPPVRRLNTFADTHIGYHLVSEVPEGPRLCRLRQGRVLAVRPKILTAEALQERYEGFGEEARKFADMLLRHSREDSLRVLEYKFKNEFGGAQLIHEESQTVVERIVADLDERSVPYEAVLACPDPSWKFSLLKFTLDETRKSFPENIKELAEHDVFDAAGRGERRKNFEIETLFEKAARDPEAVRELGKKLKEFGLFELYQDRFFALFRHGA
ncbi:MAG: hypothetical protein HY611_08990 [Elusimicrobia bacterium]|nr:hypothetical protein [Elusimicrobiota bacterium]